jgi:hypothetical protein
MFLCQPISAYWDFKASGTCMNAEVHFFSTAVVGHHIRLGGLDTADPGCGEVEVASKAEVGTCGSFWAG